MLNVLKIHHHHHQKGFETLVSAVVVAVAVAGYEIFLPVENRTHSSLHEQISFDKFYVIDRRTPYVHAGNTWFSTPN